MRVTRALKETPRNISARQKKNSLVLVNCGSIALGSLFATPVLQIRLITHVAQVNKQQAGLRRASE